VSFLRRIEPFLYSRKNIAGTLLALVGLGLLFGGVTSGLIGLGVVAGLYAIGYLLVPPERGVSLMLRETSDSREIEDNLRKLLVSIHGRVADDVFAAVGSVAHAVIETLPKQGEAFDSIDPNVHLVRETALSYLPEALSAYLAIPRMYAERRQVAGGKTAHDVLLEQLQVMNAKLDEIRENIAKNDTDRLMSNARFLQERFASSTFQPTSVTVAAPESVSAPESVPAPELESVSVGASAADSTESTKIV